MYHHIYLMLLSYIGTSYQARINTLKQKKGVLLRKKYNTYSRHVTRYNQQRRRRDALLLPSFDEVVSMPVTHGFWDIGGLSHPEEEWASNEYTQQGIKAYLMKRAAGEELRRIARETRHLIRWALEYQEKIDSIQIKILHTQSKFALVPNISTRF